MTKDATKKFRRSAINDLQNKNLLPFDAYFLSYSCYNEYTKRNHKSTQIRNEYTNRVDSNKNEKQNCTPSEIAQGKVKEVLKELIFDGKKIL